MFVIKLLEGNGNKIIGSLNNNQEMYKPSLVCLFYCFNGTVHCYKIIYFRYVYHWWIRREVWCSG